MVGSLPVPMIRLSPLVATLCLVACAFAAAPSATVAVSPMQTIPAEDPRLRYEGRFDQSDPAAPAVIWQGSRIAIDFEGSALAVRFDWVEGQNYFDVTVDGTPAVVAVNNAGQSRLTFPYPLGSGSHRLTLFKRSEAAVGIARFRGIEIALGAHASEAAPPRYKLKLQFFGDSITAGACNGDGDTDQWDLFATHNNAESYAAFTAAALEADYRNISVSGMGIVTGYVPHRAGQIWDRLYPVASSPRAELAAWVPDVICLNFGENDDSFTHNAKLPFPTSFTAAYVALVRAIRSAYPAAHIVILRGGMHGGANSEALHDAWGAAVRKLKAGDPRIYSYVFQHWSTNHPRVSDHRLMAEELTTWLGKQRFMQAYR